MTKAFISITPDQVREIHDLILETEIGLAGEHNGYLEGALHRIAAAQFMKESMTSSNWQHTMRERLDKAIASLMATSAQASLRA